MIWSKESIIHYLEERGISAEKGFTDKVLEFTKQVIDTAIDIARENNRKVVQVSDLPATPGLLLKRGFYVGAQREFSPGKEEVVYRRFYTEAPLEPEPKKSEKKRRRTNAN